MTHFAQNLTTNLCATLRIGFEEAAMMRKQKSNF